MRSSAGERIKIEKRVGLRPLLLILIFMLGYAHETPETREPESRLGSAKGTCESRVRRELAERTQCASPHFSEMTLFDDLLRIVSFYPRNLTIFTNIPDFSPRFHTPFSIFDHFLDPK